MIERPLKRSPVALILGLALPLAFGAACGLGATGGLEEVSGEPDGDGGVVPVLSGDDAGQSVTSKGGPPGDGGQETSPTGRSDSGPSGGGTILDEDSSAAASTDVATVAMETGADATGPVNPASDGGTPDGFTPGATVPESFVCTQVMGLELTSEWYLAGFEQAPGIDDARWQLMWKEHAYIDEWANPDSTFWGIPPTSPCAQSSDNPDRVLFVALSWTLVTLADWETNVQSDVDNIKAKYPNVKQIVLMTIIRGPDNVSCGNTTVVAENTLIPSYVDQALADVAAASTDGVTVAPQFAASSCSDFMGTGPHLTAAGNAEIAQVIGAAYANE
jgi:hypothetical protein